MLNPVAIVALFFDVLTSEKREKVLIFDDSIYDRSRSKVVELLSWIHDHNLGCNLKGFKLLTLGWSDGNSFLPPDFVLCSSPKPDNGCGESLKRLISGTAVTKDGLQRYYRIVTQARNLS